MFYFIEPETLSSTEKSPKRRKPNMFIMYRKDMMKYKPHNMPMTKYSKLVSGWWKNIPAEEKARLQRRYQIDRDQKRNVNARADINQIGSREDKINQDYRDQIDSTDSLSECNLQRKYQDHRDLTINEANNLPKGMKKDCYLTDSLSENF
ncbi:16516_t:CDS:1 [Funneliformis caledonium]|uniref:16516_t:CDS:1 n=1 Tax=Funneliformis caledonium TaxID=1117310 RepID=A0A9N9CMK7_9GLOM|nr:16516_t:CDS:1 [Funneliformis caledonium]